VRADHVSRKLAVVDQAHDISSRDAEDVRRILGGQLRVVCEQMHRRSGGKVGQQLANGCSGRRRQLNLALIGADRDGATAVWTTNQGRETFAFGSGDFKRSDFGHMRSVSVNDTNTTNDRRSIRSFTGRPHCGCRISTPR